MLKDKKYKFFLFFLSLILIFVSGTLGYSAYQIDKAQQIISDFQKLYSPSTKKYTFKNLKEDIVFVQIGKVSPMVCHKLVKAYFPYPHRFYANNKYVAPVAANELCYQEDTVDMVLQFSQNKWSYAHRLECEGNDDCRKGVCHLGVCEGY